MPLTGPHIEELYRLIPECFDELELEILLVTKMAVEIHKEIPRGGLRADVHKIAGWLERRGKFVQFLTFAMQEREGRADFCECARTVIRELNPIQDASDSLRKVDPATMAPISQRLLDAADSIDYVEAYKTVHDALLTMQTLHGRLSVQVTAPDADFGEVRSIGDALEQLNAKVRSMADRPSPREAKLQALATELEDIHAELASGIRDSSLTILKSGDGKLRATLSVAPQKVNRFIVDGIDQLGLAPLYDQMNSALNADAANARVLVAFAAMRDAIQARLDQHDTWQEVTDMVRRIADSLAASQSDLEAFLPSIASKVRVLCKEEPSGRIIKGPTAALVTQALEGLELALPKGGADLRNSFTTFMEQAGKRFFYIDLALLDDCNDLKGVAREFRRLANG